MIPSENIFDVEPTLFMTQEIIGNKLQLKKKL